MIFLRINLWYISKKKSHLLVYKMEHMKLLKTEDEMKKIHHEFYTKPLLNTRHSIIPQITNPNLGICSC